MIRDDNEPVAGEDTNIQDGAIRARIRLPASPRRQGHSWPKGDGSWLPPRDSHRHGGDYPQQRRPGPKLYFGGAGALITEGKGFPDG